jgi:hypothetical protein
MKEQAASESEQHWLQRFQSVINAKDYDAVNRLCSPSIMAFGTVANVTHGLEWLIEDQYKKMWPQIVKFEFAALPAIWRGCGLTVIAVLWDATNWRRNWFGRRVEYQRSGRATLVLQKGGAVHTHFSITP